MNKVRSLFVRSTLAIGAMASLIGAAHAERIDFSTVNLAAVSSPAGEDFAISSGGTVNVRLISGEATALLPGGSRRDPTGLYVMQDRLQRTPAVLRVTLSSPHPFVITQNETLTAKESNSFHLSSGTWTILNGSHVSVEKSVDDSDVTFQGTTNRPPYGDYQIQANASSFDFTVTNEFGFPAYGSAISLNVGTPAAPAASTSDRLNYSLLAGAATGLFILSLYNRRRVGADR